MRNWPNVLPKGDFTDVLTNTEEKELPEKTDWNSLSFADWLKISAVILIAGLVLYRCLLPFRAEYAFREAFGYENRMNDTRLDRKSVV